MPEIKQKCMHCGKEYTLGVNGIISGCDECQNVVRASNGYALEAENEQPLCSCLTYAGDSDDCPIHVRAQSA